jgi:hypothetical protein
MSYDLGVWYSKSSLSDQEAGDLYSKLSGLEWMPAETSPAVEAFYKGLTSLYPEINSVPESEIDSCPWNCALHRSGGHVLICIAWSRVEEVAPIVISMAGKQGLICFDPQTGKVHLPLAMKTPRWRFRF